jgi:tetratricopeptide (TPR) repeat protein/tRNA A-37 threonylcarbamoyl transferase component Bud32
MALSVARRIDVVRDEFELAIKTGKCPRIEDYLARLDGQDDRRHALEELLLLEVDYRRERDPAPRVEDYVRRFPQDAAVVENTIRRRLRDATVSSLKMAERSAGPGDSPAGGNSCPIIGDYELIEKIGEGGMGVVYKARQRRLDRIVAVKTIRGGQFATAEDVQRFHLEAAAAANLQHPGIVAIHEVGEDHGVHFFSMEFVEGRSLAERLRENTIPPKLAAALVEAVANAVHFAHGRGVLHRDLKPSNILLDPTDRPRVVDFGLAKRVEADSQLTRTGQVLGTPSYMPPEQAAGTSEMADARGDVYSLGAVLYELLTGRPPFRGASAWETIRQVLETDPMPPRRLDGTIPKDLETICLKCLDKRPERRYATADALAEDLRRFQRGEPISARPVGALLRAVRWCQRKPLVAGLSAAVVLALATGAAVSTWFGIQARYRTTEASQSAMQFRAEQDRAELEAEKARLHQQKESADGLLHQGSVHFNNGRLSEAADCYERANQAYAALANYRPAVAEYRSGLADSLFRLGHVHLTAARLPQAVEYCQQAVDVYRALVADHPAVDEYRIALSIGHRRHCRLRWTLGEKSDAAKALANSIESLEVYAADNSVGGHYRDTLIMSYTELAQMRRDSGEFSSAIAAAGKAIELEAQPRAAGTPSNRSDSKTSLNLAWRGDVHVLAGQYDQAKADYQRAIDADDGTIEKARIRDWRDRLAALTNPGKWRLTYYRWQENDDPTRPESWKKLLTTKPLAVADATALHLPRQSTPPAQGVPADYFALVAQTEMEFDGGEYDAAFWADDGARLFVDGKLVLDGWKVRKTSTRSAAKLRPSAGKHALKVEFFKATGDARLTLAITPRR